MTLFNIKTQKKFTILVNKIFEFFGFDKKLVLILDMSRLNLANSQLEIKLTETDVKLAIHQVASKLGISPNRYVFNKGVPVVGWKENGFVDKVSNLIVKNGIYYFFPQGLRLCFSTTNSLSDMLIKEISKQKTKLKL